MKRLLALLAVLAIVAPVSAATVDGMRIQSAVAGAGNQTVILVHGWTCDSSSWDAQVPVLAARYRVITVDLPGHGKSDSPKDGKFSMDLFARAVEAVRAEANADKSRPCRPQHGRAGHSSVRAAVSLARRRACRRRWPARHARLRRRLHAAEDDRAGRAQGARGHDPRHVHAANASAGADARAGDDAGGARSHRRGRHAVDPRPLAPHRRGHADAGARHLSRAPVSCRTSPRRARSCRRSTRRRWQAPATS